MMIRKEEMMGINPAALGALLDGDLENFIVASTPGGIEAQEARGQRDFVANETLPCKPAGYRETEEEMRLALGRLGIEFVEQIDDLFWYVRLPEGWKKEATDHSMWSHLLDDKGRKRASIFYKAAFYDRSAHITLTRRFSYRVEPVSGYDDPNYRESEWHCVVTDCEQIVWSSDEKVESEPPYEPREQWSEWSEWSRAKDSLFEYGKAWLDDNYPEWANVFAYWD